MNEVYSDYIKEQKYLKGDNFIHSLILLSLLSKEKLGTLLVLPNGFNIENFMSKYQYMALGAEIPHQLKDMGSEILFYEFRRLDNNHALEHLENNIKYLNYLKYFESYTDKNSFIFAIYVIFIKNIKLGIELNKEKYLQDFHFQEESNPKSYQINNHKKIIHQLKEYLVFEEWNKELLEKFYEDLKTPFPYIQMGITNRRDELKIFEKYSDFLNKLLLKNLFEKSLEKSNNKVKNIKI
jgi:hypothetical protein